MSISPKLLDSTFLYHFAVPCRYAGSLWSPRGIQLPDAFRLPHFGQLEGRPEFADVRMAWNEKGLAFTVRVSGKKQPPWCRDTRLAESDGLQVWIDTRNTHNVHRASRFCQRFVFLPLGAGPRFDQPVARMVPIERARELPKPIADGLLAVRSERRIDGYVLEAHIPAEALTGFEPAEHPRLGFSYAVADRELGPQTFTVGNDLPFQEDPSLWGTVELASKEAV